MEPTRCVAANKVGTCSDEHGSFEKWIMRSLGMTLCQTRAGAGDIPLVIPATMSPTYEQGQVRDAMITHLPLFCCRLKALRHTGRTPFRRQRSQKV